MSNRRRTQDPAIPDSDDPSVSALKEFAEVGMGHRGLPIDRFVRVRDLRDAGLVTVSDSRRGGAVIIGAGPAIGGPTGPLEPDPDSDPDFGQDDLTRPPAPTGVRARGLSLNTIGVTWKAPQYTNHAYTEVFASLSDNWSEIEAMFNAGAPIGAGNQTDYFMGTAAGTTFIHSGLGSTVPALNFERDVFDIFDSPGDGVTIRLSVIAGTFVSPGDRVYLTTGGSDWASAGQQGTVLSVNDIDMVVELDGGDAAISYPVPDDAVVTLIPEDDALAAALNPQTVYYWVRFVSTAGVSGPVQSEAGVQGSVMINPDEVLNILTGRIRSSQLAQDIISPINFIRGPVTELDEFGNRRFPTVRDFVTSLGGDLISEYDEALEQVFLGFIDGAGPKSIIRYTWTTLATPVAQIITDEAIGAEIGDTVRINAAPGTLLEALDGVDLIVQNTFFAGIGQEYLVRRADGGGFPGDELVPYDDAQASLRPADPPESEFGGIASAATYLLNLAGRVSADGAWIESLENIQAAIQNDDGDLLNLEGITQIIGTIANKSLVRLGLEDAALAITENLQFEIPDPDDPESTIFVAANEAASLIYANEESITQSITFKAQQNIGGVLFSAGFGLGLESDPLEEPVSTFAVAADQFAIMSAANHGRVVTNIQTDTGNNRYQITVQNSQVGAVDDGLVVGARCTITTPFGSPVSSLKGRTFEVVQRTAAGVPTFLIFVKPIDPETGEVEEDTIPPISANLAEEPGHAIFPEQSVPFIVRTDTEDGVPVIGIRGRLIVDGMITATEIEVTDLLRANEIWATSLTAFGLIRSPLVVGETITTPLFGGWGVKIAMEDTGFDNRVLELSRWGTGTQTAPTDPEQIEDLDDPLQYPQIANTQPDDTSFWLRASDGSVYVRGNLTVGGNARFWTGYGSQPAEHFIQMDQEFPLFIMQRTAAAAAGIPMTEGQGFTYTQPIINAIKRDALLWANEDGTIGFNTNNGAIFAGDTPLEPPSGWGSVRVINRLDDGAPTGFGRVWASVSFQQLTSVFWPDSLVGCSYALFLADASTNYGGLPTTVVPSQRPGLVGADPTAAELAYLDTHFLIIRATSSAGSPDPGYAAYQAWRDLHPELQLITEYYNHSPPGNRLIQGALSNVAGGRYKLLAVIIERAALDGTLIWGSTGPYVMPVGANFFCQQVANTIYDGVVVGNTGTSGGTPPIEDGGDPPGPDPGDPLPPVITP